MRNSPFIIFIIAGIVRLVANMTWFLGGGMDNENQAQINCYFISVALLFGACTWYIRQTEKYFYQVEENISKRKKRFANYMVADFFFNLAGTKVITELFFDATQIAIYEYWNLILCVLIMLIRIKIKK